MADNVEHIFSEIPTILDELIQLTEAFATQAQMELAIDQEIVRFEQARKHCFQRLQPLFEQQSDWLKHQGREALSAAGQGVVEEQLASMRRLQGLDKKLVERLSMHREGIGHEMARLRTGRRGLSGYQSSRKSRNTGHFKGTV